MSAPDEHEAPARRRPQWWMWAGTAGATFVAVVGALSGMTDIATFVGWHSTAAVPTGSPSTSQVLTAPTQPATSATGESSKTLDTGACLDATSVLTSCDAPHAAEVVSISSSCDPKSLLGYLGGAPGADFLLPSISYGPSTVQGTVACLLNAPLGAHLESGAADSLRTNRGDVWRWCVDGGTPPDVGCAMTHTAEVVGLAADAGAPLDCQRQADAYTEAVLANVQRQVAVERRDGGSSGDECIVEARGDNVLTASVRRLRSRSLPIQAG